MQPRNSNHVTDAALVRRFKAGDLQAFDEFVRRHQDRLYRLATLQIQSPSLAEDAVQEVFLRAYKGGLGRFRLRAAPATWLYATLRNVVRELQRKHPANPAGDFDPDTLEHQTVLAETVDHRRMLERIDERLSDLSPREREAVMLRLFEGLTTPEAAAAMGCRGGTVKALLHTAVKKLRGALPQLEDVI